jgi:hypothetical protein
VIKGLPADSPWPQNLQIVSASVAVIFLLARGSWSTDRLCLHTH